MHSVIFSYFNRARICILSLLFKILNLGRIVATVHVRFRCFVFQTFDNDHLVVVFV